MQAGNTHQTLASHSVDPVTVDTPAVEPQALDVQKTLLEVLKQEAATKEARRIPVASATQPPTGTAPIEYKAPALGPKSPSGPASVPYTAQGRTAVEQTVTAPTFTSLYATREEFEALLERIDNFNSKSGQKI